MRKPRENDRRRSAAARFAGFDVTYSDCALPPALYRSLAAARWFLLLNIISFWYPSNQVLTAFAVKRGDSLRLLPVLLCGTYALLILVHKLTFMGSFAPAGATRGKAGETFLVPSLTPPYTSPAHSVFCLSDLCPLFALAF